MKKRAMLKANDAIDYTAKAFAILTYYKIKDDVADEKLIKRVAANALTALLSELLNPDSVTSLTGIRFTCIGIVSFLVRNAPLSVLARCNAFCLVSFLPAMRVYSKEIRLSVER